MIQAKIYDIWFMMVFGSVSDRKKYECWCLYELLVAILLLMSWFTSWFMSWFEWWFMSWFKSWFEWWFMRWFISWCYFFLSWYISWFEWWFMRWLMSWSEWWFMRWLMRWFMSWSEWWSRWYCTTRVVHLARAAFIWHASLQKFIGAATSRECIGDISAVIAIITVMTVAIAIRQLFTSGWILKSQIVISNVTTWRTSCHINGITRACCDWTGSIVSGGVVSVWCWVCWAIS